MFRGAVTAAMNGRAADAGPLELIGVRLPQVQFPVAWAVLDEPCDRIRRDAEKRGAHTVIDLIAAPADARPDVGGQILRRHAEIFDRLNRGRHDSGARAAPARMNRS